MARRFGLGWLGLLLIVTLGGCISSQQCARRDGQVECVNVGGPGEAAITGAAAGAVWAAGARCQVTGCHPPLICNEKNGLCEHARCGEGSPECPAGSICDSKTLTCR